MIAFLLVTILAFAPIHSGAFTLRKTISSCRTPSTNARYITGLDMAVQFDRPTVIDSEITVEEIRRERHLTENKPDGASFDKWVLQLLNDSVNTRSYVCRCLVQVAKLSEEESYQKMVHAHEHGEAIIGEYCQEHAEFYEEALTNSGLVCEIFPADE
jgi:ATP-dependent Clp protease adapter protein ClpS